MTDNGFKIFSTEKKTNLDIRSNNKFQNTYNQIWLKN